MTPSTAQRRQLSAWAVRVRTPAVILASCLLFWLEDLRPTGFPISLALMVYGALTFTKVILHPRSWLDLALAGSMAGATELLLIAEALSALQLLGSPIAWVNGSGVMALMAYVSSQWRPGCWPKHKIHLDIQLPWWAWALLSAFAVQIVTAFILTWFSGINVADTLTTYLPRSVRYLQNGTLNVYGTFFDSTPYLHQMLVAHQLVFLRSDILVNPLSFGTCLLISVSLYAWVRSLNWHGALPIIAATLPFTMAVFLIHASTSNFDTLEALMLLLALYFLRRGAPGLQPRWLMFAALATGLACATKSTFWFAAPGLGLIWAAVVLRSLLRRRIGATVRWLLPCILIVAVVGTPYLIRNLFIRGTLLGSEPAESQIFGPSLTVPERLQRIVFMDLAMTISLLSPPFLLGDLAGEPLSAWFRTVATSLGYDITDPRWSMYNTWEGALRHGVEPYAGDHAYFGSAILLVIVPACIAVFVRWQSLGGRRWFLLSFMLFAAFYMVSLGAVSRYHISLGRYLIEMVTVLTIVAPTLFAVLPKRIGMTYAVIVSLFLLFEMRDQIQHNRQMPIDRVASTPREVQYHYFFGGPVARSVAAAKHAFEEKYPVSSYPEVFVDFRGAPNSFDQTFLGTSLTRRLTHWSPVNVEPPIPPGPLLTRDEKLAERFSDSREVSVDRLSYDTWLLLPNNVLRVIFTLDRQFGAAPLVLTIRAAAPVTFAEPDFRFVLVQNNRETVLQEFSGNSEVVVPVLQSTVIRIETRDQRGSGAVQTQYVGPEQYFGL